MNHDRNRTTVQVEDVLHKDLGNGSFKPFRVTALESDGFVIEPLLPQKIKVTDPSAYFLALRPGVKSPTPNPQPPTPSPDAGVNGRELYASPGKSKVRLCPGPCGKTKVLSVFTTEGWCEVCDHEMTDDEKWDLRFQIGKLGGHHTCPECGNPSHHNGRCGKCIAKMRKPRQGPNASKACKALGCEETDLHANGYCRTCDRKRREKYRQKIKRRKEAK